MVLSVEQLKNSLDKVQKMASDVKNPLGILLKKEGTDVHVCYSDGKKAMVDVIEAQDTTGLDVDVILPYKQFIDIIGSYANSGELRTKEVEFNFDSEKQIIELVANCDLIVKTGEYDENNEEILSYRTVNRFSDKIKYNTSESSGNKFAILTRCNYSDIISLSDYDEWEKSELQSLVGKLNKEDGKVCYISGKLNAGFVANTTYVSFIPNEAVDRFGFTATSKTAKCIVDVLSKVSVNKVYVFTEDNRYCKMMADDGKFGLWFEMAPGKPMDINKLARYQKVKVDDVEVERGYNDYRLVMNRASLAFTIKRALNSDKNDSATIMFSKEGDVYSLTLNNDKNKESSDNRLILDGCEDSKQDIENLRLGTSLKMLNDIISSCSGEMLILAFEKADDNNLLLKVGDIGKDKDGETVVLGSYYTMVSSK